MNIQVLYFGALADIIGESSELLEMPDNINVGGLKELLLKKYPRMDGKKFKVAVNHQIAIDQDIVFFGSEVALLPPFAGG